MTRATEAHLQYAKGVLRYLKGVMDRRITWCAENARDPHQRHEIWASADSSFADTKPLRKSTFCYQLFVNNAVFSWKAGLSSIVATSTCEAELMAFVSCACEVVYARKLAGELGFPQLTPTKIYEDNQGALVLVDKMHLRNRSKHIGLRFCLYNALKSLASSLGSTILPLTSILILAPSSSPKMPSSIISPRRSAADKEDLSLRRVFASWVFRLDLGILARSWVLASLRWPHSYRAGGGETPKMKALG